MNVTPQLTKEQKDTIIATLKNKRESFASKLTPINICAFGIYLLLFLFGAAVTVGDVSFNYWDIFTAADMDNSLSEYFSYLVFPTVLIIAVLVGGLILNCVWRDWNDPKHNKIKYIATYALFALHIIQLFIILSMNFATWSLILPGWAFWIHGILAWAIAAFNLLVIVYDIQISKYQLVPTV